jgi:hypothetical protein
LLKNTHATLFLAKITPIVAERKTFLLISPHPAIRIFTPSRGYFRNGSRL